MLAVGLSNDGRRARAGGSGMRGGPAPAPALSCFSQTHEMKLQCPLPVRAGGSDVLPPASCCLQAGAWGLKVAVRCASGKSLGTQDVTRGGRQLRPGGRQTSVCLLKECVFSAKRCGGRACPVLALSCCGAPRTVVPGLWQEIFQIGTDSSSTRFLRA